MSPSTEKTAVSGELTLPELHRGTLIRRYKRFLADVRLDDGTEITAHCPNPGRMTSCQEPGWEVWLTHHPSPKRKLKWTWELSRDPGGTLILVNTQRPNAVLAQALRAGQVPALAHYQQLQTEVRYGQERSRIDVLLSDPGQCYVELKSVTLLTGPRQAAFPDAVTARGAKHLRELSSLIDQGDRAILFFLVSRGDADHVGPAREIDPKYGQALDAALATGVEVMAHRLEISDPAEGAVRLSVGPELQFSAD